MLQTVGLFTFIRNTRIKTIALLFTYLFIALLVSFAFSLMLAIVYTPGIPEVKFASAMRMFALEWHRMLGGAILWAVLASIFFRQSINKSVEAVGIERSDETRLFNIVENLAISTGLPVPQIHIIESPATNAFMSGFTPSRMSLTVTRGMLKTLDDEQIKAVLAHEFVLALTGEARRLGLASMFTGICVYFALVIVKPFYKRGVSMLIVLLALPIFPYEVATVMVVAVLAAILGAITLKLLVGKLRVFVGDAGSLDLTKDPEALVSAIHVMSRKAEIEGANFLIRPLLFVDGSNAWFSMHPSAEERIAAIRTYIPTVKVPSARAFPELQTDSFGLREQLSVPTWVSRNAVLVPVVAFALFCGLTTRWTSIDRREVLAQKQDIQITLEAALAAAPEGYRPMVIQYAEQLDSTYDLNLDMEKLNSVKSAPQMPMTFSSGKMPTPTNGPSPDQLAHNQKIFDEMNRMNAQLFNNSSGSGVVQFSSDDVIKSMKAEGVSPDAIALYEQQYKSYAMAQSNISPQKNQQPSSESPALTSDFQAFERLSNASWNKGTSGLSTVAIPALILFVLWRILLGIGGIFGWFGRIAFDR
jgi:heat shock protein HtpX